MLLNYFIRRKITQVCIEGAGVASRQVFHTHFCTSVREDFPHSLFRPSNEFNTRIWDYHDKYIYNKEFQRRQKLAFKIFRRDMNGIINKKFKSDFKDIIFVGSFREGTYVNDKGIEFDVNVVMDMERACQIQESKYFPGHITLHDLNNEDDIWRQEILKPVVDKIRSWGIDFVTEYQAMIRNFIPNGPAIRIECSRKHGPAGAEVEISYCVDIAPVFEIPQNGKSPLYFVAKGLNMVPNVELLYGDHKGRTNIVLHHRPNVEMKDMVYRISTSLEETKTIQSLPDNKRAVLRICKQMLHIKNYLATPCGVSILDSYYLKNAFLHELHNTELTDADWEPSNTTLRVIYLWIRILEFLQQGNFPAYYSSINLIESVPTGLRHYLTDKIVTFLSSEEALWQCFTRKYSPPKS